MIYYSLTSNVLNYMLIGQCSDTTNGETDSYGTGCDYYKYNQDECGVYDKGPFKASTMCCVCGGGKTGNVVEFSYRYANNNIKTNAGFHIIRIIRYAFLIKHYIKLVCSAFYCYITLGT